MELACLGPNSSTFYCSFGVPASQTHCPRSSRDSSVRYNPETILFHALPPGRGCPCATPGFPSIGKPQGLHRMAVGGLGIWPSLPKKGKPSVDGAGSQRPGGSCITQHRAATCAGSWREGIRREPGRGRIHQSVASALLPLPANLS